MAPSPNRDPSQDAAPRARRFGSTIKSRLLAPLAVLGAVQAAALWISSGSPAGLLFVAGTVGAYALVVLRAIAPLSDLVGRIRGQGCPRTFERAPEEIRLLDKAWSQAQEASQAALCALEHQKRALDQHAIVSETDTKG